MATVQKLAKMMQASPSSRIRADYWRRLELSGLDGVERLAGDLCYHPHVESIDSGRDYLVLSFPPRQNGDIPFLAELREALSEISPSEIVELQRHATAKKHYKMDRDFSRFLREADIEPEDLREMLPAGRIRALDIGCGEGRTRFDMAAVLGRQVDWTGISLRGDGGRILEGDFMELPVKGGFGLVIIGHSLSYMPYKLEALARAVNLLSENGVLILYADSGLFLDNTPAVIDAGSFDSLFAVSGLVRADDLGHSLAIARNNGRISPKPAFGCAELWPPSMWMFDTTVGELLSGCVHSFYETSPK
ncbi:MAG: hypothetical protein AB1324_08085 [Candidatus Micrarchaeota archaeon]